MAERKRCTTVVTIRIPAASVLLPEAAGRKPGPIPAPSPPKGKTSYGTTQNTVPSSSQPFDFIPSRVDLLVVYR